MIFVLIDKPIPRPGSARVSRAEVCVSRTSAWTARRRPKQVGPARSVDQYPRGLRSK